MREEVGPDAANFSDFGASLPVTVQEIAIQLNEQAPSVNDNSLSGSLVAMYFITKNSDDIEANDLASGFADILKRFGPSQVRALVANVPVDLPFDPDAYFGSSAGRPRFDLVLAIHLHDKAGVSFLRTVQKNFEETYASHINLGSSWIAFGQRALLFDQDQDIKVCFIRGLQLTVVLTSCSLTPVASPIYIGTEEHTVFGHAAQRRACRVYGLSFRRDAAAKAQEGQSCLSC